MKNSTNISLEALASLLNSKVWNKGEISRIYIDRGYNTKKMSTKTYVYMIGEEIKVSCYVDCANQPVQWCQSQANEVIESVQEEIADLIKKSENPEKWDNMPYSSRVKYVLAPVAAPAPIAAPVPVKPVEAAAATFEIGAKYLHNRFGEGVCKEEGQEVVVIDFNGEYKKLLKKFVTLQKVA
jgi:hypothetical protein